MKALLLNLPHPARVQRRYMCSYNAPNMLFPPHDLVALGGILKHRKKTETYFIDAIAEELSVAETIRKINAIQPELIISLCGFECLENDLNVFGKIGKSFPDAKTILFGHYPTHFPREILSNYHFDYVIIGEPDLILSNLYDALAGMADMRDVNGIAYREGDDIIVKNGSGRINRTEELPMPAHELTNAALYSEPFLKKPFGLIQTARGCPYTCNYCVKSFGKKLTLRTPEQIIEEIQLLQLLFGIQSLRFIDDTFTAISERVIRTCELLLRKNIKIEWTCLSRPDTLNDEMIRWMKKAGCKRIYFGIESGSPAVLKYYDKEMDMNVTLENLMNCKKHGIETAGFFVVGAPVETEEDFEMSVQLALNANLDYMGVTALTAYPGTPLFEKLKDQIDFSILPYVNRFKDEELNARREKWEKEFYKRFYFRPRQIFHNLKKGIANPAEFAKNGIKLAQFVAGETLKKERVDFY